MNNLSYYNQFNLNLMTSSFNQATVPDTTYLPGLSFRDGRKKTTKLKRINLEIGSLNSIWYSDYSMDTEIFDFRIDGVRTIKKARFESSPDNSDDFETWLSKNKHSEYNLLIVVLGQRIKGLDKILEKWASVPNGKNKHSLVFFDPYGLVSLTARANHCYEVSEDGSLTELYPDF